MAFIFVIRLIARAGLRSLKNGTHAGKVAHRCIHTYIHTYIHMFTSTKYFFLFSTLCFSSWLYSNF